MEAITNKRAHFDYVIDDTFEAGIELLGFEVKSVRNGKANIAGSYVKMYNNEAWLVNATIAPYQEKNVAVNYDPQRPRKLLLHKEEIKNLIGKQQEKGLTLVPIKLYNKQGKIKLSFGLGRSKKKGDKREMVKRRDIERETGRHLKS